MFSLICIFSLIAAASAGIVHPAPLVASAVPAPIVTARSSQVIARNYNTFAAAPLAYTAPAALTAPAAIAAPAAFAAPAAIAAPAAFAAPAAHPLAYSVPAHPLAYSLPAHPLAYTAPAVASGPLVFKK